MKKKTHSEIEQLAFKKFRNTKLLSNQNIDCYVYGFDDAQRWLFSLENDPKELLNHVLEHIKDAVKFIEDNAGYGGRCMTDYECAKVSVFTKFAEAIQEIKKSDEMAKLESILEK